MRITVLFTLVLLGAGCGGRVDGNAEGVTISGITIRNAEALRLADQHCGRYGKAARIEQTAELQSGRRNYNLLVFDPANRNAVHFTIQRFCCNV